MPRLYFHMRVLLCTALVAHAAMLKSTLSRRRKSTTASEKHTLTGRRRSTTASEKHVVAWVHFPKAGTSFGTTLAHYMNDSLPEDAAIEPQVPNQAVPELAFIRKYPASTWFQDLLWLKDTNWGDHTQIKNDVWDKFNGNFFGMFRDPRDRVRSSWYHFGFLFDSTVTAETYAQSLRGTVTKMLAGQAHGLECTIPTRPCDTTVVPDLAMALHRLSGFKFIGLTEQYDLSLCLFHVMFGGECLPAEFSNMRPGEYDHDNPTLATDTFTEVMDVYDTAVHTTAQLMFWKNVQKYNVTRRQCAEVCNKVPEVFAIDDKLLLAKKVDPSSFDYDWPGRFKLKD